MNRIERVAAFSLFAITAGTTGFAQRSSRSPAEGPQPMRVIVRAEGSKNLGREDLQVKVAGKPVQVNFVRPLAQERMPVEVVIALDEGMRNFGNNLSSIKHLVESLPPNASVIVGYMRNGQVVMNGGFTNQREVAERAIRLPQGTPGANGSPYFTVTDLAKRWPSQQRAARFLLMVTNGVDPYNGRPTPMNQSSPYVDEAISAAQRAGITVYTIFWGNNAFNTGYAGFSGQSYLTELSEATGGELLSGGISGASVIDPYVDKFVRDLERSYVIGFDAPAKRDLVQLKVQSHGAKVKFPNLINAGY